MGHHHKKRKQNNQALQVQESSENTNNMDLGSMLQNLNLGDIDLSKVDMNKVQSIMNNMNSQGNPMNALIKKQSKASKNNMTSNQTMDPRIDLLDTLKEILPGKKAKKIEKFAKLLRLTNTLNNRK